MICVGAANSLANPKRLLRSVPPALYEIGTALVVAVTVLPQFAESVRRVRAAQSLRAGETGRVGRLRRFLVPVLEDALERSLALAAGMDTRGYGRSGGASRAERRLTGALMLAGLVGVCVGRVRRTRPDRAAVPGPADAGGRRGRRGRRAGQRRPPGAAHPLPAGPLALARVRRDRLRDRRRRRRRLVGQPATSCRSPTRPLDVVPAGQPVALLGGSAWRSAVLAAAAVPSPGAPRRSPR